MRELYRLLTPEQAPSAALTLYAQAVAHGCPLFPALQSLARLYGVQLPSSPGPDNRTTRNALARKAVALLWYALDSEYVTNENADMMTTACLDLTIAIRTQPLDNWTDLVRHAFP